MLVEAGLGVKEVRAKTAAGPRNSEGIGTCGRRGSAPLRRIKPRRRGDDRGTANDPGARRSAPLRRVKAGRGLGGAKAKALANRPLWPSGGVARLARGDLLRLAGHGELRGKAIAIVAKPKAQSCSRTCSRTCSRIRSRTRSRTRDQAVERALGQGPLRRPKITAISLRHGRGLRGRHSRSAAGGVHVGPARGALSAGIHAVLPSRWPASARKRVLWGDVGRLRTGGAGRGRWSRRGKGRRGGPRTSWLKRIVKLTRWHCPTGRWGGRTRWRGALRGKRVVTRLADRRVDEAKNRRHPRGTAVRCRRRRGRPRGRRFLERPRRNWRRWRRLMTRRNWRGWRRPGGPRRRPQRLCVGRSGLGVALPRRSAPWRRRGRVGARRGKGAHRLAFCARRRAGVARSIREPRRHRPGGVARRPRCQRTLGSGFTAVIRSQGLSQNGRSQLCSPTARPNPLSTRPRNCSHLKAIRPRRFFQFPAGMALV